MFGIYLAGSATFLLNTSGSCWNISERAVGNFADSPLFAIGKIHIFRRRKLYGTP